MTELKRIDPRGPRFGAAITSVLALASFVMSTGLWSLTFGYPIMVLLFVLFAWSVFSPKNHPYQWAFKKFVQPKLKPPAELEDPRPPQFAQKVGFGFAILGTIGGLISSWLIPVAAAFIFIAAFLNAFFGLCLGCQMYLGLRRLGVIR
jgi:hypothetical protein